MFVRFFAYVLIILLSMIRSNIAWILIATWLNLFFPVAKRSNFLERPASAIASLVIKR